jgi:PKHD-type hydroxylase
MNLKYYYWYFQSVISPKTCDLIIKQAEENNKKEDIAITGNFGKNRNLQKNPLTKKETKDLKKKRNSNIIWLNDLWIYREIHPYINTANKNAGWNFEWDWSETCQFTKYKKGQYYDWHCDSWEDPYTQEGPTKGKIRKLSVTVSLSDPKDYKGGELEFDFRNQDSNKKNNIRKCTEILPRGSLVVFPSFVWHRVKPVIKGVRRSLVIWNLGYPFK